MIASRDDAFEVGDDSRATSKSFWPRYLTVKPILDFSLAALLALVTLPIVIVSMVLVSLSSSGPALYTQRRLGKGGRSITIFKIRTMYEDSEVDSGPIWSHPGDPRVTPVGRFLRWAHLDELPQLINVLAGDMSLIGPRPERPEIVAQIEKVVPNFRQRLQVRPGLTGLAQVLQPPDTDLDSVRRKLNYDLYYVAQMSPWLDLKILVGTVIHLFDIPGYKIARALRLPDDRLHESDSSFSVGELPAGSAVQPYYIK